MMRPARSSTRPLAIESLAGWVFADLLLVLFLVGLGSQVTQAHVAQVTPLPIPEQQPAEIIGMDTRPQIRDITVNAELLLAADPGEQAQVAAQIRAATADLTDRQSAMVLIWGESSDVTRGQSIARAVGALLETGQPDVFTPAGARKDLWAGAAAEGSVGLEIYRFTRSG